LYLQFEQEQQDSAEVGYHFNVMRSNELEGFPNSIVEGRPNPFDGLILPVRPGAVRQQNHSN
jgi:hypothetical protein